MSGRWRFACPEGHRNLRTRHRKGGYYCSTCNAYYPGAPVDLAARA